MAEQLKLSIDIIDINPNRRRPVVDRRDSRGWVKYGSNNLFPDEVVEVALQSPTVAAILHRYVDYTVGGGIKIVDAEGRPHEAEAIVAKWANGEGAEGLIRAAAQDLWTFGAFSFQVLWGREIFRVLDVLRQDWQGVRIGFEKDPHDKERLQQREKEGREEITRGVWISPLWRKYSQSEVYQPKFYEYFKPDVWSPKKPVFLVHKNWTPALDTYPMPPWYSGYMAAKTEVELEVMRHNLADRALVSGGILELPQTFDPAKKAEIERTLREDFIGADNAGKIMVIGNSMGAEGAKVNFIPFTNGPQDRDLRNLQEQVSSSIIKAFSLPSPTLIGLPGGASLGGDGGTIERAGIELFSKVIRPAQDVITAALEKLVHAAGYPDAKVKVEQNYPGFDVDGNQLTASAGVSGALAQATTALLAAIPRGELGPDAAAVLLEQLGYDTEKAKRMVQSQVNIPRAPAANGIPI